jgi:predicted nucleic acid-binding protein
MIAAVLDTTVLISLRKRYSYTNGDVERYVNNLYTAARFVTDLPVIQVVRDPNDDFVLATAIKAQADYLITFDNDLLVIKIYNRDHHAWRFSSNLTHAALNTCCQRRGKGRPCLMNENACRCKCW